VSNSASAFVVNLLVLSTSGVAFPLSAVRMSDGVRLSVRIFFYPDISVRKPFVLFISEAFTEVFLGYTD
jgi:hypothetical protein